MVVTTLQCGCFVGALAAGYVADKLGRRPSLLIAAIFAIIGTIMQAAASGEIAAIYVGRFLAGLGVGAASMVTPLYSKSSQLQIDIRHTLTVVFSQRECTASNSWRSDWYLSIVHHDGYHVGILDQLRQSASYHGRRHLHCASLHASTSCGTASGLYVLLQRECSMASPKRPLGRCDSDSLFSAMLTARPSICRW